MNLRAGLVVLGLDQRNQITDLSLSQAYMVSLLKSLFPPRPDVLTINSLSCSLIRLSWVSPQMSDHKSPVLQPDKAVLVLTSGILLCSAFRGPFSELSFFAK